MKTTKPLKRKQVVKALGDFTVNLLLAIQAAASALPQPLESKREYYRRVYRQMADYPESRVYQGVRRLEKQGLLKEKKKPGYYLKLTVLAKQKLLIREIKEKMSPTVDGFSTIVLFDIPEPKRRYRYFLRRLLQKNGFINLQKSALIGRFELPQEFFELLEDLIIRKHVSVLKAKILYK